MLRLQRDGRIAAHPGDSSWCDHAILPYCTWGINHICFNAFTLDEELCFQGAVAAEIKQHIMTKNNNNKEIHMK